MLDYKVYKEKRKKMKAAKREFEREEHLWEGRLLEFAKFFKENNFLLILNEEGKYQYTPYHEFYPARYMSHNRIIVTSSAVSMTGVDCDGDQIGVMKIKMEDLFREDYEAYFLEIYNRLRDEESRREKESKEKRERALYEELSKKYGKTKAAQQDSGTEVQSQKTGGGTENVAGG